MADLNSPPSGTALSKTFARKVRLSTLALAFERVWPRLWLLIGLGLLFALVSLAGLWPHLPLAVHQAVLAVFALAAIAALIYAVRIPWPTREEAVRRIERRSGVPHRPATSYEDTLSAGTADRETAALWQAHRQRLKRAIDRLRVGNPSPRADRFDPFAVRLLAVLALVPVALLTTGSFRDRLASAFRFGASDVSAAARLDAWVTPPPYTGLPPILLADGSAPASQKAEDKSKLFEVPEGSLLTLRGSGLKPNVLALEVLADGAQAAERVEMAPGKADDKSSVAEVRYDIRLSSRVRALSGTRELAQWTFDVTPDGVPVITLSKDLPRTPKGSMKLSYTAKDDYGIASAEAKVRLAKPRPGDPAKAWARAPELAGPRLPLERPPVLPLKIPRPGAKDVEGSTLLELGAHPWAGQRVELWLEATDIGGKTGRSAVTEVVLPARRFKNPLARALIEQRRKLAEDSRYRPLVAKALDALTLEPEGFIDDPSIYLSLRDVYHRLARENSRDAIRQSVDQLWYLALKIEDGKLSDAERALKDAQDRLSEALEKGADDKEIQERMAELKQRLADYLKEMQKNAEKENNGGDQEQQQDEQVGQQDLDQMMQDLERSARQGSREEAEKMLSELRELMDRLQAGNTPEARAEQKRAQEMMKKLNQLSDLAGKQQQLMDETFSKQRQNGGQMEGGSRPDQGGQQGRNQRQGKTGPQGQQQPGRQGQQADRQGGGQQGEGQQGQDGQGIGQRQPGQGDPGDLRNRQSDLRKELEKLQKDLDQMGVGDPEKLGAAEDAMAEAERNLNDGDYSEAAEQQGEALKQMRDSAKQMAEQMQQNAQQRLGRGGNTPRDPFGRPQRAKGPDMGNSVKVPDAIDAQRAREILEELRRRSGQSLRPPSELDYIDRLLKRF